MYNTKNISAVISDEERSEQPKRVRAHSNSNGAITTDITNERPNSTEPHTYWTFADSVRELHFLARWPIINSTDVLEIYSWTTRKALEFLMPDLSAKAAQPAYSDTEYDYYPGQLEHVKVLSLPHPFLVQAIQQSRQWQEDVKQCEEKTTSANLTTRCLTIGLKRRTSSRCILLAVLGNCSPGWNAANHFHCNVNVQSFVQYR
jgi:hypothetical protein